MQSWLQIAQFLSQHREVADVTFVGSVVFLITWLTLTRSHERAISEKQGAIDEAQEQLIAAQKDNAEAATCVQAQGEVITVLAGAVDGLARRVQDHAKSEVKSRIVAVAALNAKTTAELRIRELQADQRAASWRDAAKDILGR